MSRQLHIAAENGAWVSVVSMPRSIQNGRMSRVSTTSPHGQVWRYVLAFSIGIAVIAIVCRIQMLGGRPIRVSEEWPILLFHILMVSAPFLVLARLHVQTLAPWLLGVACTAFFWSMLVMDAMGRRGNANIGLGFLMLASPFIIMTATIVAARWVDARRSRA